MKMTPEDNKVLDVISEALGKLDNPYKDDYDFVEINKIVKVGNVSHHSTIESYCSGPRLAKLIDEKPNTVEDIFYEYKDDDDLDFNIYCTDGKHADALYKHLLLKGQHSLTSFDNNSHGTGHFVICITVKTLNDKEKFVEALRKLGYNPNGG